MTIEDQREELEEQKQEDEPEEELEEELEEEEPDVVQRLGQVLQQMIRNGQDCLQKAAPLQTFALQAWCGHHVCRA